jgi:hypothetical protein
MISLYSKILSIFLLFLGESLAIYAEIIAARTYSLNSKPFLQIFLKTFIIIVFAGVFLLVGYMLGINAFKNIWIVSVTSITSILIMEPILAYTIFQQLPTKGAIIGFILGVIGFVSSILF